MKKILLALAVVLAGLGAQAQTLTINNYTPCAFDVHAHSMDGMFCPPPPAVGSGLNGSGMRSVAPFSSITITNSDYVNFPTPMSVCYPHSVHFVGYSPDLGTACTGAMSSMSIMFTACGTYTATWTDLPGGSAQVDVR